MKPPSHLGEIVRQLRQAAGLTRRQLGTQTNLSASTIRNLETARHLPTAAILRKLLQHAAMATLPQKAAEAGLSIWGREALLSASADDEQESSSLALLALHQTAAAETLERIGRLLDLLLGGILTAGKAEALLRVLGARNLSPTLEQRQVVLACRDPAQMERWLDASVAAPSIAEVLGTQ